MLRLTLSRKLLLVFALVAGQWLFLAHGFEHPAVAGDRVDCEYALSGQHHGFAPAVTPVPDFWIGAAPALAPALRPDVVRAALRLHPIRGPPTPSV